MYVARYPDGRQRSAVMALLDLAQRQVGAETNTQGWLPIPVIEYVAAYLDMPYMRVSKSRPSTPCTTWRPWAGSTCRSAAPRRACCAGRTTSWPPARIAAAQGCTTPDGLFTLTEVECMGNCANRADGPDQRR
jgi:NADH-quinone oxidoreductase subunit E